jgi:dolichyl-phosphate beta-glucosyltransferase
MRNQPPVSLVIPAYQEEKRIGHTIRSWAEYLDLHQPGTEVILVCDGCTDRTAETARSVFSASRCNLHIIELPQNKGKGFAVRTGIAAASGKYLFFTDADLSFAPDTMDVFLRHLGNGADIVIGHRKEKTPYSGLGRRILGRVSAFIVERLVLHGIRDSQAGHKAFRRNVALDLFARLRTHRFLFDLEILVMAQLRNYRITPVPLEWKDREGSTVRLVPDSLRALRDLVLICLRRITGRYK